MPPTIIETVGRLAFELDPPPAAAAEPLDEPDEPDEQAATVSVVAHTAASPARDPFLRPILGMVLTPDHLRWMREEANERSEAGGLGDGLRPPGQQPPLEQADQPLSDQRDHADDDHPGEDAVGV